MKYFFSIFFILVPLSINACNTTPINSQKNTIVKNNNKTAKVLEGKMMTSLVASTALDNNSNYHEFTWCRYTGNINPNPADRLRGGICYMGTDYPRTNFVRNLNLPNNAVRLPRASSDELNKLKKDLIQIDFSSIESSPRRNYTQGTWFALFCYEDPNKPSERAQCMEAFAPLTHPKTDAVLQVLQRFAKGNSMDPR